MRSILWASMALALASSGRADDLGKVPELPISAATMEAISATSADVLCPDKVTKGQSFFVVVPRENVAGAYSWSLYQTDGKPFPGTRWRPATSESDFWITVLDLDRPIIIVFVAGDFQFVRMVAIDGDDGGNDNGNDDNDDNNPSPDPGNLTGLALQSYQWAQNVPEKIRKAEAANVAKIFESVAGMYAAGTHKTAYQLFTELNTQLKAAASPEWVAWIKPFDQWRKDDFQKDGAAGDETAAALLDLGKGIAAAKGK